MGTEDFRVLAGQANSLWNEGIFETIIDATNLNQSFIRQAQIRATGRLAPGLTGMVSLEAPETQYTSVAGVFNPNSNLDGGASPAFNTAPDLLGRLTYRNDGLVADLRGMLRRLTRAHRRHRRCAAEPGPERHRVGPRRPRRDADALDLGRLRPDTIIGMAYYGQGIGRYFVGNTAWTGRALEYRPAGRGGRQPRCVADLWRHRRLPALLDAATAQQLRLFVRAAGLPVLRTGIHRPAPPPRSA